MKMGKSTREAFGEALAKLGGENSDVVVVDGDVHNSTRTDIFAKKFPERFFNVGIAESDLVGIAAGLACSLPNFTVVVPADEPSTHQAVKALAGIRTPAYLRAGRPNVPLVYENGCPFTLGKANQLRDGKDLTIIACGLMVAPALEAAEKLAGQGIKARVLDMHTVKPVDDAAVLAAARETGRIVVAEEHLLHGGLGSVVAMSAARQQPVPMRFVGLRDTFAESGKPEELLAKYGLTAADIERAALDLLGKKAS